MIHSMDVYNFDLNKIKCHICNSKVDISNNTSRVSKNISSISCPKKGCWHFRLSINNLTYDKCIEFGCRHYDDNKNDCGFVLYQAYNNTLSYTTNLYEDNDRQRKCIFDIKCFPNFDLYFDDNGCLITQPIYEKAQKLAMLA